MSMKYYNNPVDVEFPPCVIALGKFDGVHKGHREIIKSVIDNLEDDLCPAVFTFDKSILKASDDGNEPILSESDRIAIFEELGIEYVACYTFDDNLKNMDREQFVKDILIGRLNAKKVVIGVDFRFGRNRLGDVNYLESIKDKYGFDLIVVDDYGDGSGRISSSRIREALRSGDVEEANAMLNRPYSVKGIIIHGRELGRTIGIRTTNVRMPDDRLLPALGAYVTGNVIEGEVFYGITNLGYKPTVDGKHLLLETHLFDFDRDVYGKEMTTELLKFVRSEERFSSVDELQEQINKDIAYGLDYVNRHFNKYNALHAVSTVL